MKLFPFAPLAALLFSTAALAAETEVSLPKSAPYYDRNIIQDNVLQECTTLGSDLSSYIAQALESNGFKVQRSDAVESEKGSALDVKITNIFSAGNAFTGHKKTVSIVAKMQKDGQVVATRYFTRNSMGGFAGGFKSSCQVLDRTVSTLAVDVAVWYKKQPDISAASAQAEPASVEAKP